MNKLTNIKTRNPDGTIELVQVALAYETKLRSLLWEITKNVSDVEELVQQTYLHLLESKTKISSIENPIGFVCTIARNIGIDFARHKKIVPIELVEDFETLEILDDSTLLEDAIGAQQELNQIMDAVRQLPLCTRKVFILRKVYGLSQEQIAERQNISEHTVEQHLAKGARILANILGTQIS